MNASSGSSGQSPTSSTDGEKAFTNVEFTLECGHVQVDKVSLRSATLWVDNHMEVKCRQCDDLKFVDRRVLHV